MLRVLITVLSLATFAPAVAPAFAQTSDQTLRGEAAEMFGTVTARAWPDRPSAELTLGQALFWDTAVSTDGKTACASCHPVSHWGADPMPGSLDAAGKITPRQSPTVFNAEHQPTLRWLGDRKSLADQAERSLTGSMGFPTSAAGVEMMRSLGYEPRFRAAYPNDAQPLTAANYGRALAAYQATLTTPAPLDAFLAGKDNALTAVQKKGMRVFIETGCAACHNGPLLGGTTYQKFGITQDYWTETGSKKVDVGRFAITKQEEDRYVFRVPMLRNIARTGPYFHDGSVAGLNRAVGIMAKVQLGVTLDAPTTAAIVAFLGALTGPVPAQYAPPPRTTTAER